MGPPRIFLSMCYLRTYHHQDRKCSEKIVVCFLRTRCDRSNTNMVLYDPFLDATEYVKGGRGLSDLKFLKSSWSCPEKIIPVELRTHIWQQFWDMCAKNRWVYHSKYSVSIATKHPGDLSEKQHVLRHQVQRAEELCQIVRGPERNPVGIDPLPFSGPHEIQWSFQCQMIALQDKINCIQLKQEELELKQSVMYEQVNFLKEDNRNLKRQVNKLTESSNQKKGSAADMATKLTQVELEVKDLKKKTLLISASRNDAPCASSIGSSLSNETIGKVTAAQKQANEQAIAAEKQSYERILAAKQEAHDQVLLAEKQAHERVLLAQKQAYEKIFSYQEKEKERSNSLYDDQVSFDRKRQLSDQQNALENDRHKRDSEKLGIVVNSQIDCKKLKAMRLLGLGPSKN